MIIPHRSKDIVEAFIDSGEKYVVIDISRTGRSKESVYNALLTYLQRHEYLDVSIRKVKGDLVLVNDALLKEDLQVH
jgi:hypothetical protein